MPPKRYLQQFKEEYLKEFPFISKSRLVSGHAFCTCCRTDIAISHGSKHDISLHAKTSKHKTASKVVETNQTIKKTFFAGDDSSTINAECLFTSFLVEHNLPINCADHAGFLFKRMFPDSSIAKNYGCARTKTASIISEMSNQERDFLKENLRCRPFAVATDGSNDVDSKLYPLVVTAFCPKSKRILNSLLAVPSLQGDATGVNIGNLMVQCLGKNNIPLTSLIALGCDNAPVMVGSKSGVASVLKQHNENIEVMGCICHLINLAAEKGSACLPFKIDEILVDIFYYLQKSSKRKERLKFLQELHETDIKKVLKHVSTHWLSVGKCLERVLNQWLPLVIFFKEEAMKVNAIEPLAFFKIPSKPNLCSENVKEPGCKTLVQKRKQKPEDNLVVTKKPKLNTSVSREERVFYFLSSDLNKAFCLFLSYIVPVFEKMNAKLQSAEPLIHVMKSLLKGLFREVLLKFVKPGPIKLAEDILKVQYHLRTNQKDDQDLLIGNLTLKVVAELNIHEQSVFYENVRKYLITSCDYMRNKFPFASEVLQHAEVAQLINFENASFSSVAYFMKRFSLYFNEAEDKAMDILQAEFSEFQTYEVPQHIKDIHRIDEKWYAVGQVKDDCGDFKFKFLSDIMLVILTIPHSNAECERIFSKIKKIRTNFRSTMSDETLENFLILKSNQNAKCYENKFSSEFLKKAKSSTTSFVKQ